jgi:hypothetical protein
MAGFLSIRNSVLNLLSALFYAFQEGMFKCPQINSRSEVLSERCGFEGVNPANEACCQYCIYKARVTRTSFFPSSPPGNCIKMV